MRITVVACLLLVFLGAFSKAVADQLQDRTSQDRTPIVSQPAPKTQLTFARFKQIPGLQSDVTRAQCGGIGCQDNCQVCETPVLSCATSALPGQPCACYLAPGCTAVEGKTVPGKPAPGQAR
jgi:hypothetical protein